MYTMLSQQLNLVLQKSQIQKRLAVTKGTEYLRSITT